MTSPLRNSLGPTLAWCVAVALGACGPPPAPPAPSPAPEPTRSASPSVVEPAPSAAALPPAPVPSASAPPEPSACPEDMVLVDGDYCEDLKVTCLEKWEAPQNHLWVCEKVQRPTECVGETTPMRYCIDRYEFPNRKGERPMIMQNFYQAQMHCARRGKRVCTEREWTKACEGPDNDPFPYGYERNPRICNGDHPWDFPKKEGLLNRDPDELERLWQGVPSGSQPECVSAYGVYDMPGNADELAASESYDKGPKSNFDNVTTGGPWYKGVRNMCRPKIYSHDESFAYYYLSWRCCAEADGKPTDPRSPKQIKRGWSFEQVELRGNNSWKLPFNPHVPGDPEYSPAGPDRPPLSSRRGAETKGD